MMRVVTALALCALGAGCLTTSHSLEVRLKSADDVDVDVARGREGAVPLVGEGADPALATALQVQPRGGELMIGDAPVTGTASRLTVRQSLDGPVATVPLRKGRFHWRSDVALSPEQRAAAKAQELPLGERATLLASTPSSNIKDAELVTRFHQPWDILPSLAGIACGGVFVLGFGAAAAGTAQDAFATSPPDQALLAESVGFTAAAAVGLGLVGYGVTTWVLIDNPWHSPVAIPPG